MMRYFVTIISIQILTILSPNHGFCQQDQLPSKLFSIDAEINYYHNNKTVSKYTFSGSNKIKEGKNVWSIKNPNFSLVEESDEINIVISLDKGYAENAGIALSFLFDGWETDNYVIMPGALYNGNRFDVLPYPYPPLFEKKDYDINKPVTITDVPRLSKQKGKSKAELCTGDLTTPALGIYFPETGKGLWILTKQAYNNMNYGLSFEESENKKEARFLITYPCIREKNYRIGRFVESDDSPKDWNQGEACEFRFKVFEFNVNSPAELNTQFLSIRNSMNSTEKANSLPFSKAFEIIENKYNRENWDESRSYYTMGHKKTWNKDWQLGWVGGCIATYPLGLNGKPYSQMRSNRNYNRIITESQAESGFFYTCGNGTEWCSDCFQEPFPGNLMLLRKNADALYWFYKYFRAKQVNNIGWYIPKEWQEPVIKLAWAFSDLWNKYGQFGQFIDIESAEIRIGGTNSAVSAIGGLAMAYEIESEPVFLQVAKQAARQYCKKFIEKGISIGGPGEILQNPDSESAFAMLESLITLFEITGEIEWLDYAEKAAALCATWMMSYDFSFPEESTFGKLNIKSAGSVWASTQNKHSAPGICTFSGDALFKLYRATGQKVYLDMIYDLAHNITQYVSTKERPISVLKEGWVNERVNTSDWEGKEKVGEVFRSSTWADISVMLTYMEIPGIYINRITDEICVFDHVEAIYKQDQLTIHNPTNHSATIRIFIDTDPDRILRPAEILYCPMVDVKAGDTKNLKIDGSLIHEIKNQ